MVRLIEFLKKKSLFKFVVVGGASTAIDFVIYMLLSIKLSVLVSKAISMIAASVFSYFVNKSFTFGNKDKTNVAYLFKYYVVFALNFCVNLAVNSGFYQLFGNKLVAFLVATLCGMTVNYLGQKMIFTKSVEYEG